MRSCPQGDGPVTAHDISLLAAVLGNVLQDRRTAKPAAS